MMTLIDPSVDQHIVSTLAEAQKSIKQIEVTTSRIRDIISEKESHTRIRCGFDRRGHPFSNVKKFIMLLVICSVCLFGSSGILFYYLYATKTTAVVTDLSHRVQTLEAKTPTQQP